VLGLALSLVACDRSESPAPKSTPPGPAEFRELDRGVGLMGQFDFASAHEIFNGLASR